MSNKCFNCNETYQRHQIYEIGGVSICCNCVDDVTFICKQCEERRLEINRSESNPEICSYCEK